MLSNIPQRAVQYGEPDFDLWEACKSRVRRAVGTGPRGKGLSRQKNQEGDTVGPGRRDRGVAGMDGPSQQSDWESLSHLIGTKRNSWSVEAGLCHLKFGAGAFSEALMAVLETCRAFMLSCRPGCLLALKHVIPLGKTDQWPRHAEGPEIKSS